jgi:hypothetical protein
VAGRGVGRALITWQLDRAEALVADGERRWGRRGARGRLHLRSTSRGAHGSPTGGAAGHAARPLVLGHAAGSQPAAATLRCRRPADRTLRT